MPEMEELDSTLDQPLLGPHDHTLLLRAVQAHADALLAALAPKLATKPLPSQAVLRAIRDLSQADHRSRDTAEQVGLLLEPMQTTALPPSYAATLETLDRALAAAQHPMQVLHVLMSLRDERTHEKVIGFQLGVRKALELLGDALEETVGLTSTAAIFGTKSPVRVARACARGSVWGALVGRLVSAGPEVSAIVGGTAAAARVAVEALIPEQH
jgi:hypothetical protein